MQSNNDSMDHTTYDTTAMSNDRLVSSRPTTLTREASNTMMIAGGADDKKVSYYHRYNLDNISITPSPMTNQPRLSQS
ncbi:unnamed protein product, partial [Adineta ricciae]